jgi:hypothetical protein
VFNGCEECARLWREYAAATAEHIRLEDQLKQAVRANHAETMAELMPISEAAAVRRKNAREAIDRHEAITHRPEMTMAS